MLCMLYTIAVGTCLALAGLLLERALPPAWPRRWIWCSTLVLSIVVPPLYRARHNVALAAFTPSDAGWWVFRSWDAAMMRAWGVASILLILWGIVSIVWVSWRVRKSRPGHMPSEVDGVPVSVTDALGPATVGLWRSRVVIPRWVLALPGGQRQYVLRHEDEHRKAHDTQLLFLSSLVLVLTPWNLPLYWQLRRLSLAVEMDCDHRVVAALGNASVYGQLLLDIAQLTNRTARLQPSFLGGVGMLERRLKMLVAPKQLSRLQRLLLPAVAIGLLYVVLSAPHPVIPAQHDSQTTLHHVPLR